MRISTAVTAICAGVCCASASAQSYPSKPVRIIVPTSPPGSSDLTARLIAEPVSSPVRSHTAESSSPLSGGLLALDRQLAIVRVDHAVPERVGEGIRIVRWRTEGDYVKEKLGSSHRRGRRVVVSRCVRAALRSVLGTTSSLLASRVLSGLHLGECAGIPLDTKQASALFPCSRRWHCSVLFGCI